MRLRLRTATLAWSLTGLLTSALLPAAVSHGFRVPDGFEVTIFASDDLAHDIFCMNDGPGGPHRSSEQGLD